MKITSRCHLVVIWKQTLKVPFVFRQCVLGSTLKSHSPAFTGHVEHGQDAALSASRSCSQQFIAGGRKPYADQFGVLCCVRVKAACAMLTTTLYSLQRVMRPIAVGSGNSRGTRGEAE